MAIRATLVGSLAAMAGIGNADFYLSTNCEDQPMNSSYSMDKFGNSGGGDNRFKIDPIWRDGIGNPGKCYEFKANWNAGQFDMSALLGPANWFVRQDRYEWISSIDFSTDYRLKGGPQDLIIFLYQGRKAFVARVGTNSITMERWLSASDALTNVDFVQALPTRGLGMDPSPEFSRFDANSHPVFGPKGEPIRLYVGSFLTSTYNIGAGSKILWYDNIRFHVHTEDSGDSEIGRLLGLLR